MRANRFNRNFDAVGLSLLAAVTLFCIVQSCLVPVRGAEAIPVFCPTEKVCVGRVEVPAKIAAAANPRFEATRVRAGSGSALVVGMRAMQDGGGNWTDRVFLSATAPGRLIRLDEIHFVDFCLEEKILRTLAVYAADANGDP